jgi:hypothetical protein
VRENSKSCLIAVLVVLILALATGAWAGSQAKGDNPPLKACLAWLDLIDRGAYAQSWDEAAAFFKNVLTKERWLESLNGVRKPLGDLVSRELASQKEARSLPGAPDGLYNLFQFKTSFAHKQQAMETLTLIQETDGTWRAVGYFIK